MRGGVSAEALRPAVRGVLREELPRLGLAAMIDQAGASLYERIKAGFADEQTWREQLEKPAFRAKVRVWLEEAERGG
jgi:hypothetical protein